MENSPDTTAWDEAVRLLHEHAERCGLSPKAFADPVELLRKLAESDAVDAKNAELLAEVAYRLSKLGGGLDQGKE